jgi:hypothetical protein
MVDMEIQALHVVVHHKFDPEQDYDNTWGDDLLKLYRFETTDEVADHCRRALDESGWVYVHRCRLDPYAPTIASRGKVAHILRDGARPYVALENLETVDKRALHRPPEGHNHYYAPVPSWR